MKLLFHGAVALALGSFVLACQSRPEAPKTGGEPIVARVGDQLITAAAFQKEIERIENRTPQVLSTHPQKKRLLEQFINLELLYQEALRQNFDESFEFKARLAQSFAQHLGEEAAASITEEAIARHYDRYARRYDQVSARHIILRTERLSPEEDRERYLKMQEILAEAKINPDRFPNLASRYSEDSNARNGGDLGFFGFEAMVPEFSEAAFALKSIGEISDIVKTQYGYHIIQLIGERRGLEAHQERIRKELIQSQQSRTLESELNRLKEQIKTEIYEESLLQLSPLPEGMKIPPEEAIPSDVFFKSDK